MADQLDFTHYDTLIKAAEKQRKAEYANFLQSQINDKKQKESENKKQQLLLDLYYEKKHFEEKENFQKEQNDKQKKKVLKEESIIKHNFDKQIINEKELKEENAKFNKVTNAYIESYNADEYVYESDKDAENYNNNQNEYEYEYDYVNKHYSNDKDALKDEFMLRFFTEQTKLCNEYKHFLEELYKEKDEARRQLDKAKIEYDKTLGEGNDYNTKLKYYSLFDNLNTQLNSIDLRIDTLLKHKRPDGFNKKDSLKSSKRTISNTNKKLYTNQHSFT